MNASRDESYTQTLDKELTDPGEAAAYLDTASALGDTAALLVALRHVANAHGMAATARRAELGDKTLFKALSGSGNPTVDTLARVLHAVGLRLSVTPAKHAQA